ncbi:MAG: hypothetical protein EXR70_01565 [Deltaproteobacteria bacterium]|nr:hypothetical protein [Deltaproteobacteria bacterium]
MKKLPSLPTAVLLLSVLFPATALAAEAPVTKRAELERIERALGADVPKVLCLDDSFTTGAQPTAEAYGKAAANGFRAVLSLRTNSEGIDLVLERARVESQRLRYFNIPVNGSAPRPEQADEFLRIARDKSNHPMLVNCASANRVGAFMMILRVVDQKWSEGKALEEAIKIGLASEVLQKFAKDYIALHKAQ